MFILGVGICFVVAALSVWVEKLIPGELLGASIIALFMGTIMSVGKMTFLVMIFTFAMCFGGGYFVRKLFGLNWKLSNLISAGTSVNDTASGVASGYAFSEAAGDFATMVKLTRTIAIIPTVLVFAYIGTRMKQKELKEANNGKK